MAVAVRLEGRTCLLPASLGQRSDTVGEWFLRFPYPIVPPVGDAPSVSGRNYLSTAVDLARVRRYVLYTADSEGWET